MKEFVLRGGDTNKSALGCDRFSNENFFHLFLVYSELRQSGGWSCSLIPLIFFFPLDRNIYEIEAGWKSQWLGIDSKLLGEKGASTLTK